MNDGSIRIDTRIDESGFNKGIKNLQTKMRGAGRAIAGAAIMGAGAFIIVAQVILNIIFLVSRLVRSMMQSMNTLSRFGNQTESLKETVQQLKSAFYSAFAPLIQIAAPAIQTVLGLLTRVLNVIAMIMGALRGQNIIMVANAQAAQQAASGTGKMAENTKDAEKAAKGALAAFDEINVLQMESEDEGGGGGGGGGDIGFEEVPINEKLLEFFEKLRVFLEPIKEALGKVWEALKRVWEEAGIALQPLWDWLGIEGGDVLTWLRDLAVLGIEFLAEKLEELADWITENPDTFRGLAIAFFLIALALWAILSPVGLVIVILGVLAVLAFIIMENWDGISAFFIDIWEKIKNAFSSAWEFIERIWSGIGEWFRLQFEKIKTAIMPAIEFVKILFNNLLVTIKFILGQIASFFYRNIVRPILVYTAVMIAGMKAILEPILAWINEKVLEPIKEGFVTAFEWIAENIETIMEGLKNIIKGIFNSVIDLINGLLSGAIAGINTLIKTMNTVGSNIPGWIEIPLLVAPQIPRLAQGAVIPPNSQFLAVLGDQRSGRNIEAPEGLIRQIIREEMGDMGGKEVTINFAGSLGALVRELKPYIDKENKRVGRSLATGGTR